MMCKQADFVFLYSWCQNGKRVSGSRIRELFLTASNPVVQEDGVVLTSAALLESRNQLSSPCSQLTPQNFLPWKGRRGPPCLTCTAFAIFAFPGYRFHMLSSRWK